MNSLKTVNKFRRRIMGMLTGGIGNTKITPVTEKANIRTILICRPNHRLGNLLLVTPLLDEIEKMFPEAKVDIFLKGGLGPIVLKEFKNVNKFISLPKNHFKQLHRYLLTWFKIPLKKYDLVINIDPHSSSGKISTKISRGKIKLYGIEEIEKPKSSHHKHMAKRPVLLLQNLFGFENVNTVSSLDLHLSESEKLQGKEKLQRTVLNNKPTISIFTYATGNKCYSKEWWMDLYSGLQENFPHYNIIEILPKENVSQIDFSAKSFYSTDIREICSFIANTEIFIGADSGMMHLAVASGAPVAGLFSVTKTEVYEPYGQNNFALNTNELSIPEIIKHIQAILKNDVKLTETISAI